jgi:dolichyl-diphosphooligosaccharide--protein glycosyltransferase
MLKNGAPALSQVITLTVLVLSCIVAFSIRMFANVANEPMIHEFDPHFNWRCVKFIDEHGFYEFLGWYDNISWYPQGRPVGETAYPGLMYTSVALKNVLHFFHIKVDIMMVCVFMGPVSSVVAVLVAFSIGQLLGNTPLALLYAGMTSFMSGLISRSMGGAFDYECIALTLITIVLWTFAAALRTGSLLGSVLAGLMYVWLASSWGGYVFISNCIPLFAAALLAVGQYSWRLHARAPYGRWWVFWVRCASRSSVRKC